MNAPHHGTQPSHINAKMQEHKGKYAVAWLLIVLIANLAAYILKHL